MAYVKSSNMGIKSYSVIGFTYNADYICTDCAENKGLSNGYNDHSDEVTPLFADSEFQHQPHCGNCGSELPYANVIGE